MNKSQLPTAAVRQAGAVAGGQRELASHHNSETKASQNPLPSVNLPKGGGAIRSIGEKFSVNSVNGTGSTDIPIPISSSRSDLAPVLSLTYDSGNGNGPFGMGWHLAIPSITRKTDKGLPQYLDDQESDIFVLAGAEDLVPILNYQNGQWSRPEPEIVHQHQAKYEVRRYRPRIEASLIRIERWTEQRTGVTHWRTIAADNVTSVYGETSESRIEDPSYRGINHRAFSWHLSQSWDDKGNWFSYEYKPEDSSNVDTGAPHESCRTDVTRSSQRYIKRIKYGNRTSRLIDTRGQDPNWMFEVVFDYGDHGGDNAQLPTSTESRPWPARADPFSSYRSTFEVRTYRLCRRILMFHHFPDEKEIGQDCLVSAFEVQYRHHGILDHHATGGDRTASFISAFTSRAYQRHGDGYINRALPPIEFQYSEAVVSLEIGSLNQRDLAELPFGVDEAVSRWIDLDGEGIPGILTKQGNAYYYKANMGDSSFSPSKVLDYAPPPGPSAHSTDQWMDLAASGHQYLVRFNAQTPGFYRRDWDTAGNSSWHRFETFESLPTEISLSTATQFLDVTGNGLTDILIANDELFVWYPSLGEAGYGNGRVSRAPINEDDGARLLLSDAVEAIYVADMSGDGLADLVRIRQDEVCYWPNLGYGEFGPRVIMDNAPCLAYADSFREDRIRLFDIDGSGTTDILYVGPEQVLYYRNEAGNSWSAGTQIMMTPRMSSLSRIQVTDLFGRGTGTLVWSSTLPADQGQHIRYIDLMNKQKPHLLTSMTNNLGTENKIFYKTSTHFYLQDKQQDRPWKTRLAFPVQVVEREETYDYVSRNKFVTSYTYHDGYYDWFEREFRGFGMVEQIDTQEFADFAEPSTFPPASNADRGLHVPPVLTTSWFHTGAYHERYALSSAYEKEYYRESGLTQEEYEGMLLPDTTLPQSIRVSDSFVNHDFSVNEAREACRSLKGLLLRSETYALDGTRAENIPYAVTESSFTIMALQPTGPNKNAVYLSCPDQNLSFQYERQQMYSTKEKRMVADPRVHHSLVLKTNDLGQVLLSADVVYGRRHDDPSPRLMEDDRAVQKAMQAIFTETKYTNMVWTEGDYRLPISYQTLEYQLLNTGPAFGLSMTGAMGIVTRDCVSEVVRQASDGEHEIAFENYQGNGITGRHPYRRLLDENLSTFRSNDFTRELPAGQIQSRAISYMSYAKSMSGEYAKAIYIDSGKFDNEKQLGEAMKECGILLIDSDWWIPSGRIFYSPSSAHTGEEELEYARRHFFHPLRYRDAFYTDSNNTEIFIKYDNYDLLVTESCDANNNRITAGIRNTDPGLPLLSIGLDYRLLTPLLVMDPNRNCTVLAHDVLGYVAGCAIMGKPDDDDGDSLQGLNPNLSEDVIQAHFQSPLTTGRDLLGDATVRYVYDVNAFYCKSSHDYRHDSTGQEPPTRMLTIARTTHASDLGPGQESHLMYNLSYFDGFGRAIQSKSYAGPGTVEESSGQGDMVLHRWICNGWTIFNNKEKPVRKYEPFYSGTEQYEFNAKVGVSPTIFYDPVDRVVATLFPDDSWSKTVYTPWSTEQWDANDTVNRSPLDDPDVGPYFRKWLDEGNEVCKHDTDFKTWYEQRIQGQLGKHEQDAATKAAVHSETPTLSFLDSLGRSFLSVEHNRWRNTGLDGGAEFEDMFIRDTTVYDIEGNKHEIYDSLDRKILTFHWDMAKTKVHQESMEAGSLWMLHDAIGNLVYGWDSRGQRFHHVFDNLRRSVESRLSYDDDRRERLVERSEYGEVVLPNPEERNLRTRPHRISDQAGIIVTDECDFKGNILSTSRTLTEEYKSTIDWSAPVVLQSDVLSHKMGYDAANRKVRDITADGSVMSYSRNDVGLLYNISVLVAGSPKPVAYLEDVEYNARGQRVWVQHGNKTTTHSTYNKYTFHLETILTYKISKERGGKASSPHRQSEKKTMVQNLRYTYDAIGNVTHVSDEAQGVVFFRNKRVDPSSDYTYDAAYRLIKATGREHTGQVNVANEPFHAATKPTKEKCSIDHAHDDTAMALYVENYTYDAVGNCLRVQHASDDERRASWTKHFAYEEPSLLEPHRVSNRVSTSRIGAKRIIFKYGGLEGSSGNVTSAGSLPCLRWDYRNQLASTYQAANDEDKGGGERTYYRYDARGQRVRKITVKATSPDVENEKNTLPKLVKLKERIYFGPFESYRRYKGDGEEVKLERRTLHVSDEAKSFALVETRTIGDEKHVPSQVVRYQLANSVSSVQVELNQDGELLSYEEYSPYGDTTYSSWNGSLGSRKRYRYSGKEKDEESGLYYYGARYYLPVAMRWISPDPGGWKDGSNLYQYVKCNPTSKTDFAGTEASWFNRAVGAATAIGGALEIAAGVAGLAAPTGVTQVLGAVAVVHGADNVWAGLKQAYSGEEQKTFTEQGATKLALEAGASDKTAERIGLGVDLAVGIIPDAAGALLKHGGSLLAKAGGAIEKSGSVLKTAGRAIVEGGAEAKAVVVEAAHDLAKLGTAAVEHGKAAMDEVAHAVAGHGMLSPAGASGFSMPTMMMMSSKGAQGGSKLAKAGGAGKALTGKALEEALMKASNKLQKLQKWGSATQDHHAIPVQFKRQASRALKQLGLDINDLGLRMIKAGHRLVHGEYKDVAKGFGLDLNYNKRIAEYFDSVDLRTLTGKQLMKDVNKILKETGLHQFLRYQGGKFIRIKGR